LREKKGKIGSVFGREERESVFGRKEKGGDSAVSDAKTSIPFSAT